MLCCSRSQKSLLQWSPYHAWLHAKRIWAAEEALIVTPVIHPWNSRMTRTEAKYMHWNYYQLFRTIFLWTIDTSLQIYRDQVHLSVMQGLPAFVDLFILSALGRSLWKSFAKWSFWEGNNFPLAASVQKWK